MLFEKIELEPGEEVLKVVRKHWFIIVSELFVVFVFMTLPFFILFVFAIFPDALTTLDISLANYTLLITFCLSAWSVICLMSGFTIWTHYYLDLWIITDRRIILVDQIHFFNRNVSIFRLERLQDIEFYVKGFIPTMLNFGTVKAQTASAFESNFRTNGLPDPRGLQATIQKAMDARLATLYSNPSASAKD
jgi:hypothetical protein